MLAFLGALVLLLELAYIIAFSSCGASFKMRRFLEQKKETCFTGLLEIEV